MPREKTIRQQMTDLLKTQSLSARDLSQILSITEKEAVSHLYHVRRSTASGFELIVEPAACRHCGFVFETRERLSRPGKCPKCRGQHISVPHFSLREK